MASKSARIMDAALASGAIAFLLDDWIAGTYKRSEPDIPHYPNVDPATAAVLLRQHWRLGEKPIANMVHLLELAGVRVFSLAENTREVDAFSLWRDDVPYVFLNRFKSSERSRFDAAHELGHLCLHKHGGASSTSEEDNLSEESNLLEKEANEFASAFLMPEADVRGIITRPLYSVNDLAEYKKRWRVSVAALNYRLRSLNMISESKSVSNYVEMSRRGWLKNEPYSIAREQSSVLQDIINDLLSMGITKTRIAAELFVPPSEIEALLFGLANMTTIDGSGGQTPRRNPTRLRLVPK